jgi:cytochrome bd-type quinol oxidase subunit 2
MTVVALTFVPIVIAYQVWVYRVFRRGGATGDAAGGGLY